WCLAAPRPDRGTRREPGDVRSGQPQWRPPRDRDGSADELDPAGSPQRRRRQAGQSGTALDRHGSGRRDRPGAGCPGSGASGTRTKSPGPAGPSTAAAAAATGGAAAAPTAATGWQPDSAAFISGAAGTSDRPAGSAALAADGA